EQEADRIGVEMMRKAGFDPQGMVRMFNQLSNAARLNEGQGGGGYSSTHPLSIQRMSDIQNRVREAAAAPKKDSDSYWYVRAKLRVLQARDSQLLRLALDKLRLDAKQRSGVEQSAAWYGLAYSAWQKKDLEGVRQGLANASSGGHQSPEIAGLSVQLAMQEGDHVGAAKQATAAWQRWPDSQGVALARVEA